LLEFAKKSKVNDGGFGWLDENGIIDQSKNIQSWINSRMLYVFSAAKNLKIEGFDLEIEHGLSSLETLMFDQQHGGWFREVSKSGPVDTNKTCYELAFVLLANQLIATKDSSHKFHAALSLCMPLGSSNFQL
jgi:mannose/cellobiose epimerase-like protein (N-acyl-D-glucosamine 2-epimerase family)